MRGSATIAPDGVLESLHVDPVATHAARHKQLPHDGVVEGFCTHVCFVDEIDDHETPIRLGRVGAHFEYAPIEILHIGDFRLVCGRIEEGRTVTALSITATSESAGGKGGDCGDHHQNLFHFTASFVGFC